MPRGRIHTEPNPLDFGVVPPFGSANGAFTIENAPSAAKLTASITNDNSQGRFRVAGLTSFRLIRDPDGGTTPEQVDQTDGSRPLDVGAGDTVEIDIVFYSLGPGGANNFAATLAIAEPQHARPWPRIETRLIARIGGVATILPEAVQVRQGASVAAPITVTSQGGLDAVVNYHTEPDPNGLEIAPVDVSVPGGGQTAAMLDVMAAADAAVGIQDLQIYMSAFDGAVTETLHLPVSVLEALPDPGVSCKLMQSVSASWSAPDQLWDNWGIVDVPTTTFGFLPTRRLFRPTDQYQVAWAVEQAEAAGQVVRALGSGWSFSEAAMPQSSPIAGLLGGLTLDVLMGLAEGASGDISSTLQGPLSLYSGNFGYAIDAATLDRSLQTMLPAILNADQDRGSLFFVEGGMTLDVLNVLLDAQAPRVALKTMGGAAGQTIAGAISTGTHGGDFDRPPLADNVRAIYLIGAGGTHHWIEGKNAVTDPDRLRAVFPCIHPDNIHYDDTTLNAVRVSMGAMGVIYAVLLDVVPQYSLLQWNRWSTWEQLTADVGDSFRGLFDGTWSGVADFAANKYGEVANRFVQVVINPVANDDGSHNCYVSNRVEVPLQNRQGVVPVTDYSVIGGLIEQTIRSDPHCGPIETLELWLAKQEGKFDDSLPLLQRLRNLIALCKDENWPWAVRAVIDLVMQKELPLPGDPPKPQIDVGYKVMASGGASRQFPPLGGTSVEPAFSFLTPDSGARGAVDFIGEMLGYFDEIINSDDKLFPAGWVSLRVTGPTNALMGMQVFERTGMVEVSLIGTADDYAIVKNIESKTREAGGALHWGQSNGLLQNTDIQFYYAQRIDAWIKVQEELGEKTFRNCFTERLKLTNYGMG